MWNSKYVIKIEFIAKCTGRETSSQRLDRQVLSDMLFDRAQ